MSNLRGMPFILRTRQIPHALAPSEPLVTLVSCLGLKGCVVDGHILRGDDCVQRVVIAYFPTPLTERCSGYFFPPSTQKIFQLYGIHNPCKCARKSHGLLKHSDMHGFVRRQNPQSCSSKLLPINSLASSSVVLTVKDIENHFVNFS